MADTYTENIIIWRARLNQAIRNEDSWLALSALLWLENGENSIGAAQTNNIIINARSAPAQLMNLSISGSEVRFIAAKQVEGKILVDGEPANQGALNVQGESGDPNAAPSRIKFGPLTMMVIERGGKFGLRVWDNDRPERQTIPARRWFDVDTSYRVQARFKPFEQAQTVLLPDALGTERPVQMDGVVHFNLNGQSFTLTASKDDESLFIMMKDLTAGHETYPPGRYLTASLGTDGTVDLDFNRAYNPPCAFTDFATCIFAPPENHLPLRIEAGERYIKRH